MAGDAFQFLRVIQKRPHVFVGAVSLLEVAHLIKRFLDGGIEGDELGDAVAQPVRKTQCPPRIADGGARHHCSKGDDLRHLVVAVFLADIRNDFVAPRVGKVKVNVRHFVASGI